ncbi:MAG TPA: trypsin-like serine protease [Mycobacteriales bacterium]|nr:trypsin-like serine protease [Mycobacteriales bacterium]
MTLTHRLRAALAATALGALLAAPAGAASDVEAPALDAAQGIVCNLTDAAGGPVPAPPYGTSPCTGVRPGAQIQTAHGPCSMGFLFTGRDGRRYVSTAGHCVLGTEKVERSWADGRGSVAADSTGKRIGTAVYAVQVDVEGTPSGINDFALIRLDRGVAADPQVCHFGGPTSLDTSVENSQVVFQHVGTGVAGLRARSAFSPAGLNRPDYIYAHGVAYPGDSGGALQRDNGAAVGLVTQLSYGPLGNIGINRLGPHLARAGKLLGTTLTLQTAPLL